MLLFLMQEGVISTSYLPISSVLFAHRETYLGYLNAVREHAAYDDWFGFFLDVVSQALDESLDFINYLEALRVQDQNSLTDDAKRKHAYAYGQGKAHHETKST